MDSVGMHSASALEEGLTVKLLLKLKHAHNYQAEKGLLFACSNLVGTNDWSSQKDFDGDFTVLSRKSRDRTTLRFSLMLSRLIL